MAILSDPATQVEINRPVAEVRAASGYHPGIEGRVFLVALALADQPWYEFLTGVREIRGGTENGVLYYGLQILGQRQVPGDTGVGLVIGARRRPRQIVATAGIFLLPVVLSIVALLPKGRWYNISYTSPALPASLLLVALGIAAIAEMAGRMMRRNQQQGPRRLVTWATAAVLMLVFVTPNLAAARVDPVSVWDADRILKDAGYIRTTPEYPLSSGRTAAVVSACRSCSSQCISS